MKQGKIIILITICFFCVKITFSHPHGRIFPVISNTDSLISQAKVLFDGSHYDSALTMYQKAAGFYKNAKNWHGYIEASYRAAHCFSVLGKYKKALNILIPLLPESIAREGKISINTSNCYLFLGYVYDDLHEAIKAKGYFLKSLAIKKKLLKANDPDIATLYSLIGVAYRKSGKFDKAIEFYKKAINIFTKLPDRGLDLASVFTNMGVVLQNKGLYRDALHYHLKSLGLNKKLLPPGHGDFSLNYFNIAVIYSQLQDQAKALEYYFKTLNIDRQNLGNTHPYVADDYYNISAVYIDLKDIDKAIIYLKKALGIYIERYGAQSPYVGDVYNNLGVCSYTQKQYARALENYEKSIDILNQNKAIPKSTYADTYYNMGDVYLATKRWRRAKGYYKRALKKFREVFGEKNPDVAKCLIGLGQVCLEQKDYVKAIRYFDKSIAGLTVKSGKKRYYLSENKVVKNLELKADALMGLAKSVHSGPGYLKKALAALSRGYGIMQDIQNQAQRWESKIHISETLAGLSAKILDVSYALYRLDKRPEYPEKMFHQSELSKGQLLYQAMLQSKAYLASGMPDSVIHKLEILQSRQQFLKRDLLNEGTRKGKKDRLKIAALQDSLFDVDNDLDELRKLIKKRYPQYRTYIRDDTRLTIPLIQKTLDVNTGLLEYSFTDSSLYAFFISRDTFIVNRKQITPSARRLLKDFILAIRKYRKKQFPAYAHAAYDMLIGPLANVLRSRKSLLIIADDILQKLPFEALMDTQNRYLVETYAIRYHYSAQLWRQGVMKKRDKRTAVEGLAAFAPVFNDKTGISVTLSKWFNAFRSADSLALRSVTIKEKNYQALPYSEEEVDAIAGAFENSGQSAGVYLHKKASETNFKQIAPGKKYVHLATHGLINNHYPDLSGIIFSPVQTGAAGEDGVLYSGEIYGLKLDADLLTLSSCASGLGKQAKGEGVLSLTRGFLYAGVNNVAVSLWKISDKQTARLMTAFYKNILQGNSYARALQQAKLSMIRSDSVSFPRFWAGFVIIGN